MRSGHQTNTTMLIDDLYDEFSSLPRAPIAIGCSPATLRRMRNELMDVKILRPDLAGPTPKTGLGTPIETFEGLPDGAIRAIYSDDDRKAVRTEANMRRFAPPGRITDGRSAA